MRKFDKCSSKASDIINWIRKKAWKNPHIKSNVFGNSLSPTGWDNDPLDPFLPYLDELSPQLKADLSKVKFDWENYTSFTAFSDISWYDKRDEDYYGYSKDIMGPHNRMGNEVSWIGCAAGGDWEVPVFFMLYMDQGKVRAWIPKEGNCWNRTTKEAFGNDDGDCKDIKKQLKALKSDLADEDDDMMYEYVDYLKDSKKILQSIRDHFEPRL